MSGILARYLSGIGTDPLNQQGGMEGFMSQYNVNPYWQQFLQNGNPGLLGQTPQYTQGGQNPYYQENNVYKPETPVEGAKQAFTNQAIGGTATQNKGGSLSFGDITLADGRTIPASHINQVLGDFTAKGEWDKRHEALTSLQGLFGGDGSGFIPGNISDLLIPQTWRNS